MSALQTTDRWLDTRGTVGGAVLTLLVGLGLTIGPATAHAAEAAPPKPKAPAASKADGDAKDAPKADGPKAGAPKADALDAASAQHFIKGRYATLDKAAQGARDLKALHERIAAEMRAFMSYEDMGERVLGTKVWSSKSAKERAVFVELLEKMVQKTYVQRFKPGQPINITYADKVRVRNDGRAQVRTTIHVKRSKAAVFYSMLPRDGRWWVYDIVVDDASQLQTYRRSFSKILDKEGWDGLIKRMQRSAGVAS